MTRLCRVGYHFFTPCSWYGRLVSLTGVSPISHVVISFDVDCLDTYVYECGWGATSTWRAWSGGPIVPYDSLYENMELVLDDIDKVLPSGVPYSAPKVTAYGLLGLYRETLSCVTSVHRIRKLSGQETKGRTPGGIYKYLKKRLHNQ